MQLYYAKQYAEAAASFNQQASDSAGTEQTLLLLQAVISYVKAEQLTQAVQLFKSIQVNESNVKQTDLARLTRAHIGLAEPNAEEVLLQLSQRLATGSPSLFFAEFHELRATAYSMHRRDLERSR